MGLFASPEDKCVQTLKALHANRIKLEAAIIERETEVARLKAGVSEDAALDAFLTGEVARNDDGFPVAARPHAAAVEQELVDLRGARAALCRRIRSAIVDLGKARAGELRKQAARLQGELDKHLARSAELLKALEEHTRMKYAPDRMLNGDILTDAAGRESVFRRGDRPMPRSQELASEIATLRRRADGAEARAQQACEGGQVSGESIEALLKACDSPEILAPLPGAIEAWYAEASKGAEKEWTATAPDYGGVNTSTGRFQPAPAHDSVFTVCWDADGNLVQSRCNWVNRPGRVPLLPVAASVGAASDARRW